LQLSPDTSFTVAPLGSDWKPTGWLVPLMTVAQPAMAKDAVASATADSIFFKLEPPNKRGWIATPV